MSASAANLALVATVARRLGELRERMVFVGGAATALLVTDPASPSIRATRDVDVIVEVGSYLAYQLALGEKLQRAGFQLDTSEGAPLCRWIVDDVKVDVMPTDTTVLGFSNRWYPDALQSARRHQLEPGLTIRLVTAPYFLATKLEALLGRGMGDFLASHDREDIITVIDGRTGIADEVLAAGVPLRTYLADQFARLLGTAAFVDALPGHLPGDRASQARLPRLERVIERLAGRGGGSDA